MIAFVDTLQQAIQTRLLDEQMYSRTRIIIVLSSCVFAYALLLLGMDVVKSRQNYDPTLGSGTVRVIGPIQPGSETQAILELFAKDGTNIRGPDGLIIPVVIRIRPEEFGASATGTISVAVLSTLKFSAPELIDRTSLTFGRTGEEKSLSSCETEEDVNGDGLPDLMCYFTIRLTNLASDTFTVLKGATISRDAQIEGKYEVHVTE